MLHLHHFTSFIVFNADFNNNDIVPSKYSGIWLVLFTGSVAKRWISVVLYDVEDEKLLFLVFLKSVSFGIMAEVYVIDFVEVFL